MYLILAIDAFLGIPRFCEVRSLPLAWARRDTRDGYHARVRELAAQDERGAA